MSVPKMKKVRSGKYEIETYMGTFVIKKYVYHTSLELTQWGAWPADNQLEYNPPKFAAQQRRTIVTKMEKAGMFKPKGQQPKRYKINVEKVSDSVKSGRGSRNIAPLYKITVGKDLIGTFTRSGVGNWTIDYVKGAKWIGRSIFRTKTALVNHVDDKINGINGGIPNKF